MQIGEILLSWYDQYGRDLPWRQTREAYPILVSEIMLQQTQVERVKTHFYHQWLTRFPSWEALAKASNADVIQAWSGLGYNRRALMLRDIAKHIHEHGLPQTEEAWKQIKGIGPYTAAALSAFSQKQRSLPIDTNIRRVLGRILLGTHFPDADSDEKLRQKIDDILPKQGRFYDVPQAIFDLATSICTKTPQCQICPLRDQCKSAADFLKGNIETPKKTIKTAKEKIHPNKPYPDRIYRGRLLKLAQSGKHGTEIKKLGPQIDPSFDEKLDQDWLTAMITRLEKDGLIKIKGTRIQLP